MNPTIVVAGYSRSEAIKRLFDSLSNAIYPSKDISVIVSLDGGYSKDVYEECLKFSRVFDHGNVEIVAREKNIGLREHILWCGDQSSRTGSVIVLEDDILVDDQFYLYAAAAADYYDDVSDVAGIALYSQRYNEYAALPFTPLDSGYSTYLMQVSCSWGQLWTSEQWNKFKRWYESYRESDLLDFEGLPDTVKKWPSSSWKKYHSAYLLQEKKFFVYPYRSYSTNCSDEGGHHIQRRTNHLQVPLPLPKRKKDNFEFMPMCKTSITYDAFMEPSSEFLFTTLGKSRDDLNIDLYGIKPVCFLKNKKYALTSKKCSDWEMAFPLNFKPLEISLLAPQAQGDIKLCKAEKILSKKCKNIYALLKYFIYVDVANKKHFPSIASRMASKVISKIVKI